MSNGGMMVLRLGCSLSGRFAAIAPISAQLPAGFDCGPTTPLPMLHLTGGLDDTVRPDGKPSGDGFVYVSSVATTASWARALDCNAPVTAWETEESRLAGVVCTAYTDCGAEGQAVVSCIDPDETHNWPARRPGGAWPTCVTSQQADVMPEQQLCEARTVYGPHRGMDLIWSFFTRYRQQATIVN
jgi:poly(3-hydroxybutyrate) depolymerase